MSFCFKNLIIQQTCVEVANVTMIIFFNIKFLEHGIFKNKIILLDAKLLNLPW